MLLNEIAKVINFPTKKKKKKSEDIKIPDTIGAPASDSVSNKRRAKLSPSDQLRDVARQLRNKINAPDD